MSAAMGCRDAELSLGALVLGALDPAERQDVEAHVEACERCRTSLAELAALPGLLHRLTPQQAETGLPVPSPDLLERAVTQARAERASARRRRLWQGAGLAAVAAAVLVAAVLALTVGRPPSASQAGVSARSTATATNGAVHARVVLSAERSGTRLSLTLAGVPSGQRCDLVVETADGRRAVVATWQATYSGEATVTGSTQVAEGDIARLLVTTPDGGTLLTMTPSA